MLDMKPKNTPKSLEKGKHSLSLSQQRIILCENKISSLYPIAHTQTLVQKLFLIKIKLHLQSILILDYNKTNTNINV